MTILDDVKKVVIGYEDDDAYDNELLAYIDFAIGDLLEIDACLPPADLSKAEYSQVFKMTENVAYQYLVRQYVTLSVRLSFDPNGTSTIIKALEDKKKEILYRLSKLNTEEGGTVGGR